MKRFKEYISEKVDFGDPTLPPGFDPGLQIKGGFELGVSSGAIAGIDPVTFPSINYRSAAMTPGAKQDDGFVAGGQGWKIDKESKEFFTKIAKMYGVNALDRKQEQQKMQQSQGKDKSNINQERLVFDYLTNPLMSEIISGDKSKDIIKAATEMQSWRADYQNPLKRLDSWYPKSPDELLIKANKEQELKDSQNLTKIGNALRQRTIATDLFDKAYELNIAPKDNPYLKDFTDPIDIKMDMLDQMIANYELEDLDAAENQESPVLDDSDDSNLETFNSLGGMES